MSYLVSHYTLNSDPSTVFFLFTSSMKSVVWIYYDLCMDNYSWTTQSPSRQIRFFKSYVPLSCQERKSTRQQVSTSEVRGTASPSFFDHERIYRDIQRNTETYREMINCQQMNGYSFNVIHTWLCKNITRTCGHLKPYPLTKIVKIP